MKDDHFYIKDLTSTIQKSFIEFDEEFMNSINPISTKQDYLVSNGKWNAGSCCLAVIILQQLDSMSGKSNPDCCSKKSNGQINHDGDDDETDDESCDNSALSVKGDDKCSNKYAPGKAQMYTAHVGDCRAMMIRNNVRRHSTLKTERAPLSSGSDDDDYEEDEEEQEEGDFDLSSARNRTQKPILEINNAMIKKHQSSSWDDSESEEEDHTSCFHKSNDISNFEPSPLPNKLNFVTLTKDHTPYNKTEAALVRQRCKGAPFAIAPSIPGGIKRVAGSLSVTRALGDAYLKTPVLSFEPFRDYATIYNSSSRGAVPDHI